MKTVAIVNPFAGGGHALRAWSRLIRALSMETKDLVVWYTKGRGHAEILGGQARLQGFERVIAVGGDGTLFEVMNGLWWQGRGDLPSVGTVSLGTGCDYVRNFRSARDPAQELIGAMRNPTVNVGVGVAALRGLGGRPVQRVFVNVLGTGYDANVAARLGRGKQPKHGRISYLFGLMRELLWLKAYRFHGEIGGDAFQAESVMLVAGLGRYFGGGMMITPNASPLAAHFQVLWSQGVGHLALLSLLTKVYQGRHLEHRLVRNCFAHHLKIEASPPAYVEAEGELVGQTPMEVRLYPEALRFVVT
jgi:diacylglycerol kinase (ATP)